MAPTADNTRYVKLTEQLRVAALILVDGRDRGLSDEATIAPPALERVAEILAQLGGRAHGRTSSRALTPGTVLAHRYTGEPKVLKDRKLDLPEIVRRHQPGWWLTDGTGLADIVIDDRLGDWIVL